MSLPTLLVGFDSARPQLPSLLFGNPYASRWRRGIVSTLACLRRGSTVRDMIPALSCTWRRLLRCCLALEKEDEVGIQSVGIHARSMLRMAGSVLWEEEMQLKNHKHPWDLSIIFTSIKYIKILFATLRIYLHFYFSLDSWQSSTRRMMLRLMQILCARFRIFGFWS